MKHVRLLVRVVPALLASWVLAPIARAEPPVVEYEKWLPADTMAVAVLDDIDRTKARFRNGILKTMWHDPALAKARDAWTDLMGKRDGPGGLAMQDVFALFRGRIVVAFLRNDRFVACLDVKGKEREFERLIGGIERESAWRDVDFRGVTLRLEDGGGYCRDGSLVVLSNNTSALKDVLLRRTAAGDGEGSLATYRPYRMARARVKAADLFAYINVRPFLEEVLGDVGPALAAALGIDSMESVAGGVELRDSGILMRAYLHAPGKKRGLVRILAGRNTDLSPPAILPRETAMGVALSLDFEALLEESLGIGDVVSPGFSAMIRQQIKSAGQAAGVDIMNGIVKPLNGKLGVYALGGEDQADRKEPAAILVLGLADKARFQETLDLLIERAGLPVATEDFLGMTIRKLQDLSWAMLPDRVVMATAGIDGLRTLLLRHGKDLKGPAQGDGFKKLRQALPETNSMLIWVDLGHGLPDSVSKPFWHGFEAGYGGGPQLDLRRALVRYLRTVGIALRGEDDGLSLHYYIGLTKPQTEK